mgnify:CR=1 FL=1
MKDLSINAKENKEITQETPKAKKINATGKIAIFDSGVGGISFLHLAMQMLPKEDFIFYGDLANAPYGEKPKDFVQERASQIIDFLLEKGAKIIVIACNTATSAAVAHLRQKYAEPDILGMEPAIQLAVNSGEKKIILLSTPITAHAENTIRLINANSAKADILNFPCPGLMDLVENNQSLPPAENQQQIKAYINQKFNGVILPDYDGSFVLGCTHYIFLRNILHSMYPKARLYDGNLGTARNLLHHLESENLLNTANNKGSVEFYSSVGSSEFTAKAKIFLTKVF